MLNDALPSGRVRSMLVDEVVDIARIDAQAYPYPWTEQIFRDCLKSRYHCVVYESEQEMLGYAVLSVAAGEAHILNICILPERQNQGLGRDLLNYLIELAREHKVETIFLEVRASNEPAKRLYDRMGFNELGIRKNYYPADQGREDALVLAMDVL